MINLVQQQNGEILLNDKISIISDDYNQRTLDRKRLFENVFNEESKINNYHYFIKVIFGYKYFAAVLNTSL